MSVGSTVRQAPANQQTDKNVRSPLSIRPAHTTVHAMAARRRGRATTARFPIAAASRLGSTFAPPPPPPRMKTLLLLFASNVFMTLAWYGHLKWKFLEGKTLPVVILVSWAIAFFEYCLMVPANRIGYAQGFSGYQLKVLQEAITLTVFIGFAWLVLKERLTWNYVVSLALIMLAVWFAVAFKPTAHAGGRDAATEAPAVGH